jgi:hypothetical protein
VVNSLKKLGRGGKQQSEKGRLLGETLKEDNKSHQDVP